MFYANHSIDWRRAQIWNQLICIFEDLVFDILHCVENTTFERWNSGCFFCEQYDFNDNLDITLKKITDCTNRNDWNSVSILFVTRAIEDWCPLLSMFPMLSCKSLLIREHQVKMKRFMSCAWEVPVKCEPRLPLLLVIKDVH